MGLVLVFDLDQTIIDSSDSFLFERPNTPEGLVEFKVRARAQLNRKLLDTVIKRAARLRGKKDEHGNDVLAGIFLLTNNSSKIMVSGVDSVLREEIAKTNPAGAIGKYKTSENIDPDTRGMPDQPYFFDSILMREHITRKPGQEPGNPVKDLRDVKNMLGFIGVSFPPTELRENTFFFDDMDHPGMTLGSQYILISPPFKKHQQDYTSYDTILTRLSLLDGEPPYKGRNRSGAMNNSVNNMQLPFPKQGTTIRHTPRPRVSLFSLFDPPKGGSRFRSTRKNRRNKSRKRLRK